MSEESEGDIERSIFMAECDWNERSVTERTALRAEKKALRGERDAMKRDRDAAFAKATSFWRERDDWLTMYAKSNAKVTELAAALGPENLKSSYERCSCDGAGFFVLYENGVRQGTVTCTACDGEGVVEVPPKIDPKAILDARDKTLIGPLVDLLRSTGAVLSEMFGDSEDCEPKLAAIMAQIDAALAPHKEQIT